jgi:hypothetical protein
VLLYIGKGINVLGKCGCGTIMVLQREMVWYMREMVGARKEDRKPSPPPPPHTHSIHNRMLHLIQDVQKDASLLGAAGGGGRGGHDHCTLTNKEELDKKN